MQKEENFYKAPKSLWKAKGYFSPKTGKPIPLKDSEKFVYIYMLDRLVFFVETLGKKHFESQSTIAEECGLEYKIVGKILRGFVENEVIFAEKGKPEKGGRERWFYKSINPNLDYWTGTKDDPVAVEKQLVQAAKKQYKGNVQKTIPAPKWDEDESDLPF